MGKLLEGTANSVTFFLEQKAALEHRAPESSLSLRVYDTGSLTNSRCRAREAAVVVRPHDENQGNTLVSSNYNDHTYSQVMTHLWEGYHCLSRETLCILATRHRDSGDRSIHTLALTKQVQVVRPGAGCSKVHDKDWHACVLGVSLAKTP